MRSIALLVLMAACGDNLPAVPFESYAAARRHAECERQVRCGLFSTLDACEAYTYLIPDRSLEKAIADGRVVYSEDAALRCIHTLSAVTCDGSTGAARDEPEPCAGVFRGTLEIGATCAFDAECATDRCMQTGCDPSTCCAGACVPQGPNAVGSACTLDRDCARTAYCALDRTCHALGNDGATCYRDAECADGLGCVIATNPGICRPLAASGTACPYGRCALVGERCNSAATCEPYARAGDSCWQDTDCSPSGFCDAGTCANLPGPGMPCTRRCEGAAYCDASVQQCRARKENSAPCAADFECATGYCAEAEPYDFCSDRPVCD